MDVRVRHHGDLRFDRPSPDDLDLLPSIAYAAYAPRYLHAWEPGSLERFIAEDLGRERVTRELADPEIRYEVASLDGVPVAFCKTLLRRDHPLLGNAAHVERIFVAPAGRGRGIGTRLLRRASGAARAVGRDWIWLRVSDTAQRPLARYYAMGFGPIGHAEETQAGIRPEHRALQIIGRPLRAEDIVLD